MQKETDYKESTEQLEAFRSYYQDGADRSYAKTALKFKKSLSAIEKWGRAFSWQMRVEEMDKELKKKHQEKAIIEQELDYKQRNLKIIKRGILENAKAIQNGEMKYSVKTLEILINLEEKLRTGVDTNVQVNHRLELRGMSNEDIQSMIDKKVESLVGYKKLKHFNEMEDPIVDAEYSEVSTEEESKND